MRKIRETALTTFLVITSVTIFCASQALADGGKTLNKAEQARIRRFLHPMPQELRLSGKAYEVPVEACAVQGSPDASQLEKAMIADFQEKWLKKRKTALKSENGDLTIVAGLLKNAPKLQKAAKNGVFNAKYLAERPNGEQAYSISTVSEGDRITVYIAANATPGLYYGLLTLEQLFASLSNDEKLILPNCRIVDWPDVKGRGIWNGNVMWNEYPSKEKLTGKKLNKQDWLRDFANLKLNRVDAWHLFPDKLDEKGDVVVRWTHSTKLVDWGKRHAVTLAPGSGHTAHYVKRMPELMKKYPGIVGKAENAKTKSYCYCTSHPDTSKFLTEYLVSIARQFDLAGVWLTELEGSRGFCHCDKCGGDRHKAFLEETRMLMKAFEAAKKVNPKFKITLGLTQGSYAFNLEMLKYIPKDVELLFYHGNMTYKTTFQKYNLPPSIQEMKRLGYSVGSCPSPVPWNVNMPSPFQTPQYIRLLCGEAEDRGVEFMLAYLWPTLFFRELDSEALAEFLWNGSGRSAMEFTTAWATRKGLKNPAETAAVIEMLEYPERGLTNCYFKYLMPGIVKFIAGQEAARSGLLKGFEYKKHDEMLRLRKVCEEAVSRAAKINFPELLASAELMRCWMTILERYSFCFNKKKSDPLVAKAKSEIRQQLDKFPKYYWNWLDSKKYLHKSQRKKLVKCFQLNFENPLAEIKLSPQAKALIQAKEQGKLLVETISPEWKFKTAAENAGLKQKWFAPNFDVKNWTTIKAGLGYGWEKQGFPDYTGYAWYRRKIKVPQTMKNLKHCYFLFKGVDEDADVYVNGKKVFAHSFQTVGGDIASTWNKPFSFDAKSALKPGEDNIVAVRVYNRAAMGGIWKPVYLIATDQTADIKDLAAVAGSQ